MLQKEVKGWRLIQILGQGIDGIVYLAKQSEKIAAVKLFFPESIQKNGLDGELERLELQLTLVGKKQHPHLVEIFEGGQEEHLKTLYLIMEYIPGNSLDKVITKIPRELIPLLSEQLASAAKFLEDNGLVHRDIKPANIVVSDDYSKLTLLDLGIVFSMVNIDDDQRNSGDEFVASLRYSPPEFVWRNEVGTDIEAWKAITYYQIGATIHDMVMQKPLFSGNDTPRAKLYDAVKLISPVVESTDCPNWLIQTIKACLVKNWQERIKLLTWESFTPPSTANAALHIQAIRLKQIRKDELDIYQSEQRNQVPKLQASTELWNLQSKLFLMTRNFLISADIFPNFSGTHGTISDKEYEIIFVFEKNLARLFNDIVTIRIKLNASADSELSTDIAIVSTLGTLEIFKASWSEMFSPESADTICQNALLQIADSVISQE
ncbi:protein kinase [Pseudomonas fluorescens]|uniref:protein kinase domain-containing protein n=1 Tax=Pseudomonas fluorescens TaxID=294 RepID=UPI0017837994|nr:protein kinase [Pseudomonas fluorescens]MBD8192463.1 protein kinase [Pseudomonas fluorescens]MBD8227488.1 protein kinase [Pseudomonas fluorescens]MBD8785454.1 protein kinase [Pseudomonas fluorescens]MBD8817683.1 protein kinase [Pseudomonas fluorescens]